MKSETVVVFAAEIADAETGVDEDVEAEAADVDSVGWAWHEEPCLVRGRA